jgi:serine/threonine protein kinase
VKIREYEIVAGPFSGTYGSVWIGHHDTLGWKRALKRLHGHVLPEVIKQEAQKLQAVKSPHVVQIHEFFNQEGWGELLVMEFCPVGLDQHLRHRFGQTQSRLPYNEAREILEGILKGLNDAHAADIVHGDIKPANVRFGVGANEQQLGLPKLSDFGAARHLRQATPAIKGSTNWMAPELLSGQENPSKLTDYFSFGILAYLVLSGRHPFYANDPSCLTSEEDNIANPSFLATDLSTLRLDAPRPVTDHVMLLLSRDPNVREKSAHALTVALSQPWEPRSAAPVPGPVTPPAPPQETELEVSPADLSVISKAYEAARYDFFALYRPRDAVEKLEAMFGQVDWERFAGSDLALLADCWSLKGFIKNSSSYYKDAVDAATNGLKVSPDHVNSLHVRGYARIQLGEYEEATKDLERALELAVDPGKERQITQLLHTLRARQSP